VLAEERVVRGARDGIGVERRLPAPAPEETNGALAAQVRDDQRAVDTLRGKKIVLGERLEAREPLVVEAIALGKSARREITETVVMDVDARDGGRDGIERVAPVDEVVGVLAEARELERLPAVRAELRVARVRPPAVAAIDRRARRRARGGRRRPGCDRRGFVVLRLVAEAPHTLAELAENVREFPRAEDDQHDCEDEKKLRATDTRHHSLPREASRCAMRLDPLSVRIALDE